MKFLIKKLRLLTSTLVALTFLMAVTLSSCGGANNYSDDDADEATEAVEETADSAEEHPEGEGEEHPADSTAGEHPEGEHPEGEHPEGDDSDQ